VRYGLLLEEARFETLGYAYYIEIFLLEAAPPDF